MAALPRLAAPSGSGCPLLPFAVSSDKGHEWDVHPKEKAPVGERLARLALNSTYGMSHVAQYGPSVSRVTVSKGKMIIEFDNADVLTTSDGAPLRGLQIAPPTGSFVNVQQQDIEIVGNRIIIDGAKGCVRVRYAWRPYTDANLVNGAGLPASTFEAAVTDDDK